MARGQRAYLAILIALSVALWLPRLRGPLDLRYDAGVYYVLGTSLAEGRGYRLLSEPGAIQEVQYPPLLPLLVAVHQRLAGTSDPAIAGHWLRITYAVVFLAYILAVYLLASRFLPPGFAFVTGLITLLQVHTTWMSDLLFTEIPFALTTVLFLLAASSRGRIRTGLPGVLAAAGYLLRSIGIAALAAWVAESFLRRNPRQLIARGVVSLIPLLGWQLYIGRVQASPEYAHPAYAYQRAPYQYYNVSYLENLRYVDPFAPSDYCSCRCIDIAEMNRDEKSVLAPMIKSVAPSDAHSGRGNGSMAARSHSMTTPANTPPPRRSRAPPSSSPVSRLNRR